MHHGGELSVIQAHTKVEIDLDLLTHVTPFVLAVDENMVVTWASRAFLKRVQEAVGMNVAELIHTPDPSEEISPQSRTKRMGQIQKLTLRQGQSAIPLAGRWFACHEGFLLLATPGARTTEDLPFFSYDDFAQEDPLVGLLAARDETRISLKEAASAVTALKDANRELEASKRRLESVNAVLESEIAGRKKAEEALRQSGDQYRAVLRTTMDGFWIVDSQGYFLDVNDAYCCLIGYSREELLSKRIQDVEASETEDQVSQHVRHVLEKGGDRFETCHKCKDGRIVDIEVSVNHGNIGGDRLFCFLRDITERKSGEKKQAELLQQLENVNKELKDFAHIVSHDLKAPLRGVKSLVDWIVTDYADKLDEEAREQMRLLTSRVNRMQTLIDGVLQYSRIGRTEEGQVEVNLNDLVPTLIDMISAPEHITVTVENELPTIHGEQTRIGQVFQNLLSNAVKYMDKPEGHIRVGCADSGDSWTFSVADNGPGIPEQHYERIFKIFQTLAPRDQYESTGIGLTLVKKIVEMYGGRIWLTSEVGKGTTFYFTYAKHPITDLVGAAKEEQQKV